MTATHCIPLTPVLDADRYAAIDRYCAVQGGCPNLQDLARFLHAEQGVELVLDPDIIKGYATDSSNLPGRASAVGRPRTELECAVLLRACSAAGLPVTLSAGRSNLTGSATPPGGVILSLASLLEPGVRLEAESSRVRAPAGVIVEDLRRQVLAQSGGRLCFPVDPTSRSDATVGGALACNASGFTPGPRGAIRPWVESLDLLLPSGYKISAARGAYVSAEGRFVLKGPEGATNWPVPRYSRPAVKNAGGPYSAPDGVLDVVDLVVGSEGLFGAVTACALRVAPTPAATLDLFFSLPDEARAVALLDHLRATLPGGLGSLSAFEYFGINSRRYMTHESRFFRGGDPVGIFIQQPLEGPDIDGSAAAWLERLTAAPCGVDERAILVLDSERDQALFLEARHSMPAKTVEVVQQRGTFTIMTDTVVPPDRFREFLACTHGAIRGAGLEYLAFGHLGDCHLHFTMLPRRDQLDRGAAVYDRIVDESARLGGVYSGEHGTGKRKRNDFLRCYGPEAVRQIRRCKAAVDPRGLLNPGNVVGPDAPESGACSIP